MNSKNFITALVVSLVSLGAADLMGVPVSEKAFAQTNHQSELAKIMTSNATNLDALMTALQNYLVNNPDSVGFLSEAVAEANPGTGTLKAIGKAAKAAFIALSRAGNQAAASALYTEVTSSPAAFFAQVQAGTSNYFTSSTIPNCASVSCS
ncbi:MAG: hypothetical protein FIA96_07710 [Betaproteobacteria bacterium]|nr:hypothetical protein [Betaproteobacteria bacterium]